MDIKLLLHVDRTEARRRVLEKIEKSEEDVEKDVRILKNWFKYQKHLPEIPCDNLLEIFLIVNKFNLEKCKKKLEKYFTIRTEIPEFYADKNPKSEHMIDIANTVYCIPLPKLTPSLSRITVMKLKNPDPEKFNSVNYFAHTYNIIEIRVREDMVLSDVLVYDMEGLKIGHLLKLSPGVLKKSSVVFEKVFSSRVEGIHYINLSSSMQILINLAKTMLKEKIRKRVHVHEDLESLYRHLPKDLLPSDYGRDVQSLSDLHELWSAKLKENQNLFDHLEKFTTKKSNTTATVEPEKEGTIFGTSNFRNLCLD